MACGNNIKTKFRSHEIQCKYMLAILDVKKNYKLVKLPMHLRNGIYKCMKNENSGKIYYTNTCVHKR